MSIIPPGVAAPARPAPAATGHAAFDALFAAAHALALDEWTALVRDVHARRDAHDAAERAITRRYRPAVTAHDLAGGPIGCARRQRWDRTSQPLVRQVTLWLPTARVARGGPLGLRTRAWQLVLAAQRAVLVHAADGDAAARDVATVLAPFGDDVLACTVA